MDLRHAQSRGARTAAPLPRARRTCPEDWLGLLLDEQFGLLIYAPVLALAIGVWMRSGDGVARRTGRATLWIAAAYLAAVATYWLWWAGSPANPARFVVPALPVFAIPLACAWRAADQPRRRAMLALLAASMAISAVVVGVHRGDLAWNDRSGEADWLRWLGPVVNLSRGWPSFFWKLDPSALRTEASFFAHAVAWVAIFAGGWRVVLTAGLRRAWSPDGWRLALCAWLLLGLMVSTQAGWWLNGATGLDAARSQAAVLSSVGVVAEIGPMSVKRQSSLDGSMMIRGEETGRLGGPAPWLALDAAAAGTYALRIRTSRPSAGKLLVIIGDSPRPAATIDLKPLDRQAASLTLPMGVRDLVIRPDRGLEETPGRIEIEPMHLNRGAPLARLAVPYGSATVYFLDDNVFAENDGFWVRGGRTADLALDSRPPGPRTAFAVSLQSGRGSNEIAIDAGGVTRREVLGSFETRLVEVPCQDPRAGAAVDQIRVRIPPVRRRGEQGRAVLSASGSESTSGSVPGHGAEPQALELEVAVVLLDVEKGRHAAPADLHADVVRQVDRAVEVPVVVVA